MAEQAHVKCSPPFHAAECNDYALGRAKLRVSVEALLRFLELPAGTLIRGVETSMDPVGLIVHIEHADLPGVVPEAESPMLWTTSIIEDGRRRHVYDFAAFRDQVQGNRGPRG